MGLPNHRKERKDKDAKIIKLPPAVTIVLKIPSFLGIVLYSSDETFADNSTTAITLRASPRGSAVPIARGPKRESG